MMTLDNTHERRGRAVEAIAGTSKDGVDALLATDLHNVRYLTGFTGSNAALLLFRTGKAILYTDPRYTVQAKQQTNCRVRIVRGPLTKEIVADIARSRLRRIGIEKHSVTVGTHEVLQKGLPATARLAPVPNLIASLRMVKDEDEIATIRASVIANSRALEAAIRHLKPGMTESEFAAEIDYRNRRLGAEAPAFDTIVAAGIRSALPHAHPGATAIGPGIVLVDMGAFHSGYASDMTRMLHVGKAPAKYRKAYRAVLEAQLAAIDAIRPGVTAGKVDKAARNVLKAHGLEKEFVHSTGHGLGLEIHEPPRLGRRDETQLAPGMAITVEPGVYVEGWGGIRIEDTVLVTQTGCQVLTPTPKDLREI